MKDAILHHLNPQKYLAEYDIGQLSPALQKSYQDDVKVQQRMMKSLDSLLEKDPFILDKKEIEDLLSFMHALTDKGLEDVGQSLLKEVPSGLPVDNVESQGELKKD